MWELPVAKVSGFCGQAALPRKGSEGFREVQNLQFLFPKETDSHMGCPSECRRRLCLGQGLEKTYKLEVKNKKKNQESNYLENE